MKKLTVFIAALAMVATFAMSAAAAEWNFYGSARVTTFSNDVEQGDATAGVQATDVAGNTSDRDTTWAIQGNSRIGANVKVSDTLSGRFEYGTGINLRLLYGTWTFGAGSLTVGQFYTPLDTFLSNQVWGSDMDMLNTGGIYSGRLQGLMLTFGDFKVALLNPSTALIAGLAAGTSEVDTTLPKLELSYHLGLGKFFADFKAGYNTYDVEALAAGADYDVDSWILAVAGGVNLGTFYIKGNLWFGQNTDMLIIDSTVAGAAANAAGNDIDDNDSWGMLLVVGAKASDMVSIEAGVGIHESEVDVTGSNADDHLAAYVQATINLAPGVFIVPEIGYLDGKDSPVNNVDDGNTTYFGLKWQINF